jgi:hypothetical protein
MSTTGDITRLYDFTNGSTSDADTVDAEFNQLVTTANNKLNLTLPSGSQTCTATTTFSATITLSGSLNANGTSYLADLKINRGSDPSLADGKLWLNTATNILKTRINGVTVPLATASGVYVVTPGMNLTGVPKYVNTTTFTCAQINCADSLGTTLIQKTSSTTASTATTGLNGIAQGALGGSVTVVSGTNTVTVVTPNGTYQVGDVITTAGGQSKTVTAVSSGNPTTVESNWSSSEALVQYRRGGKANNCWYYLYAVTDGTTPGLLLTTRSTSSGDTLVDAPTGYTLYRQMPFAVRLDASGNITPFQFLGAMSGSPTIKYLVEFGDDVISDSSGTNPNRVLNGGTSAWPVTVDCSALVPKISTLAEIKGSAATAPGITTQGVIGSGGVKYHNFVAQNGASVNSTIVHCPIPTTGALQYGLVPGGTRISLWVTGYTVTEVA